LFEDFFNAGLEATSGVLGVFLADTGDILVFLVAVLGVTASLGLCLGDVLVIAATIIFAADLGESFFNEAETDALIELTIGVFLADFGVTAADFGVPVLDSGVPYLEPGVAALEAGVAVLMPGVACLGVAGLLLGVSTFLFLLGVGVLAVMAIAGIVPVSETLGVRTGEILGEVLYPEFPLIRGSSFSFLLSTPLGLDSPSSRIPAVPGIAETRFLTDSTLCLGVSVGGWAPLRTGVDGGRALSKYSGDT